MLKTYEEFQGYCNRGFCLRKTFYDSKTCQKELKQERCYSKWLVSSKKSYRAKDEKWEFTRVIVWERQANCLPLKQGEARDGLWQKYCQLWAILTNFEREQIISSPDYAALFYLNATIDVAHLSGKGSHPDTKYDPDNLVLMARGFHSRLDQFTDPVTNRSLTRDERNIWIDKLRSHVN